MKVSWADVNNTETPGRFPHATRRGSPERSKGRQDEFDKLKSDIEGIKTAYEYQMQLRGPVSYWRLRAEQHRRSSNWALGILLPFLVIAVASLYFLYDIRPPGTYRRPARAYHMQRFSKQPPSRCS